MSQVCTSYRFADAILNDKPNCALALVHFLLLIEALVMSNNLRNSLSLNARQLLEHTIEGER